MYVVLTIPFPRDRQHICSNPSILLLSTGQPPYVPLLILAGLLEPDVQGAPHAPQRGSRAPGSLPARQRLTVPFLRGRHGARARLRTARPVPAVAVPRVLAAPCPGARPGL